MEESLAELVTQRNPEPLPFVPVDLPRMRCSKCNRLLRRVARTENALHCATCGFRCDHCDRPLVISPLIAARTWHCPRCRSLRQFTIKPYAVED